MAREYGTTRPATISLDRLLLHRIVVFFNILAAADGTLCAVL
jgi:hypothetical protein